MLDFTSLHKAVASLNRAIVRARAATDDEELRDAVIQRFEYTYELCWRMIKRSVEAEAAVPADIDALSFKALMREAAERGIIEDVTSWLVYREQRNITAHTYDAEKAHSVYQTAVEFLQAARAVLAELERRNNE